MKGLLKSAGISTKLIVVAVLMIVGVVALNYVIFLNKYEQSAKQALVDEAKYFTAVADETKNHVAMMKKRGAVDPSLIADLQAKRAENPNYDYRQHPAFDTIPVVAGWKAAGAAAEREGLTFFTPAFNARNPENDPHNDPNPETRQFRVNLLTELNKQVETGGDDEIFAVNKEANTLHYMRAIKLDASCMSCHGAPGDPKLDPDGDGKDPLGFAMEGWEIGDMHGAFELVKPLEKMDAQVASFFTRGMAFTVPMVIVACLGFVMLLRSLLTKPVNNLIETVKDVATGDGDLTKRLNVDRQDEIGKLSHWFDVFLENLHKIITDVANATREVASAATEIAASSEQMSAGMEEQQRQSSQVSAAVEEMNASVTEVAQKANDAAQSSGTAGEQAGQGGEIVNRTIAGMEAISCEVNESAEAVGELGKRGEQIGEVINVINDIAEQTNLLALNAAIEAARAGEHGRGFAVVADEVRKLAERTTKATEEVAESIQAIQSETETAVQRMQSGRERVSEGVELARKAGESLQSIVAGSREVATMIQTIAAAAEEQSSASTEIARNMESINAVTNESAQAVQQSAGAASQLSAKAEQLQALVDRFKL